MKASYLCRHHRQRMQENSTRAFSYWKATFYSGWLQFVEGEAKDAEPYLGCAFEIIEILMASEDFDKTKAIELLEVTVASYVDVYERLLQPSSVLKVYRRAVSALEQQLPALTVSKPACSLLIQKLSSSLYRLEREAEKLPQLYLVPNTGVSLVTH